MTHAIRSESIRCRLVIDASAETLAASGERRDIAAAMVLMDARDEIGDEVDVRDSDQLEVEVRGSRQSEMWRVLSTQDIVARRRRRGLIARVERVG